MNEVSMFRIIIRSIILGVLGAVAVPILTLVAVLGFAYAFDSRCGTPADSGGCEMGSFAAAIAMVLPGFALGFLVSLIQGLRARNKAGVGKS